MKKEYEILIILDLFCLLTGGIFAVKFGLSAGTAVILTALLFNIFIIVLNRKRKKDIEKISSQIERTLFHEESWTLNNCSEGELYILQDLVQKLVIRLREENQHVKEERQLQGQLMTDISHQLRTPLTSMELVINSLLTESLVEDGRKKLYDLRSFAEHIDELLNLLLRTAKLESGTALIKQERITCKEVIRKALQQHEISLELKGIQLVEEVDEKAAFTGDLQWLSEAFSNLVKNASEHMKEGDTLTITGESNPIYTEFTFTDTGSGVAKEDLPRIFDRFYRGEGERHSGYGIGMSFVRSVVAAHNGTIRAENVNPKGMRFTVRMYENAQLKNKN